MDQISDQPDHFLEGLPNESNFENYTKLGNGPLKLVKKELRGKTLKLKKEERKGIRERWFFREPHSIPDPTGSNSVLRVA